MNLKNFTVVIFLLALNPQIYSQISSGGSYPEAGKPVLNPVKLNYRKGIFCKVINHENEADCSLKNLLTYNETLSGNTDSKQQEEEQENVLSVSATGGLLQETEELYSTSSLYQSYKIKNTFSEKFSLGLVIRIEYAKREELGFEDIKRWYDNTVLTANYNFNPYNSLGVFGGASISDTTVTSYGFSYRALIENDDFSFLNILTLSNDYFYYWNDVAQNFASENMSFTYGNVNLSAEFYAGVVDLNYIEDYTATARNPNTMFNVQLQYRIFSEPVVNAGILFNARNFKYRSPLYYSPSHRNMAGGFANFYDSFGRIYLYLNGGMRIATDNVFIWDFDSEFGYDYNNFSVSIGVGRYNDPYYANYNTFLNLTKIF